MAYEAIGGDDVAIGAWHEDVLNDIPADRRGIRKSAKTVLAI